MLLSGKGRIENYFSGINKIQEAETKQTSQIQTTPEPTSTPERTSQKVEIILTGDVMLGRSVMGKILDSGDVNYPFQNVAGALRNADIVFINLENPFVTGCPRKDIGEELIFCADPKIATSLVFAGIDVANVANNHALDYGAAGLNETLSVLEEQGIRATGIGELKTVEIHGTRFGFLGFNYVSQSQSSTDLELIRKSDLQVDVLLVGVHWGVEYQEASENQRVWARNFIKNGADVVVGHHPHWVQESEYIDGKPVYYSLGNFVFDQMWSERTKQGMAIRLTFEGGKLISEEKLPTYMTSWAQPEFINR